jgi:hypothetical protein
MKHYGILGGGACGENILEDGLRDVGTENVTYHIVGRFNASADEKRIYTFVLENEIDYVVWFEGKCPDILIENCVDSRNVSNATAGILNFLRDNDGDLLVMWDAQDEEKMYSLCTQADADSIKILELTNGLSPISFQSEGEAPPREEVIELPKDLGTFTVKVDDKPHREIMEVPDGDCMVVVVMSNGSVISTPATAEEVRVLLGMTGYS